MNFLEKNGRAWRIKDTIKETSAVVFKAAKEGNLSHIREPILGTNCTFKLRFVVPGKGTLSAIRHIVADAKLNNDQKIALIDTTLNPENGKPSQVEEQIDEFKKDAVKLQQGQDYSSLLEARSLKPCQIFW